MTRKLYTLALFVVCALSAAAQQWNNSADSTSLGAEPSRGDVVSYASADDAVRKSYGKSQYLVPLEEFEQTRTDYGMSYKTTFKVPFAWLDRQLFLHVGKVSAAYEVWVNGRRVGYTQTASTPAEWDLSRYSAEDDNTLEIRVVDSYSAQALESSRTTREAVLQGDVYLLAQPKVRVRDVSVATAMSGTDGLLSLGVILKSHLLNDKEYKVWYELISPRGEVVASDYRTATLGMRGEDTVTFFRRMPEIMTWSHEQPGLYTLVVKTQHEGRFKEYVSFNIGFRTITVDADHVVTLNGAPLRIVSKDYAPSSDIHQVAAEIATMRNEGITMLNVIGAPQSRSFYDVCDSLGMYVCASVDIDTHTSSDSRALGGNPANDPTMWPHYRERTLALYHSTKNYPCVIMYSLAANPANGYNLYESYRMLKSLEKDRPVVLHGSNEWNNDSLNMNRMASLRRTNLDSWVALMCEDAAKGKIKIANTRHYTPLLGQLHYTVKVGRKTISSGAVPVRVLPQGDTEVAIPLKGVPSGKAFSIEVEVVRPAVINKYEVGADHSQAGNESLASKTFDGVL